MKNRTDIDQEAETLLGRFEWRPIIVLLSSAPETLAAWLWTAA